MTRAETLGEVVKRLRGDLSYRDLRDASGVSIGYLHRLEHDQVREPGVRTLQAVARAVDPKNERSSYADLMRAAGYL